LADLLSIGFPEHKWFPWKFHRVPQNYYKTGKHEIVEFLKEKFSIRNKEDWSKVTLEVVQFDFTIYLNIL
jgi:hypothetical protein